MFITVYGAKYKSYSSSTEACKCMFYEDTVIFYRAKDFNIHSIKNMNEIHSHLKYIIKFGYNYLKEVLENIFHINNIQTKINIKNE